MLLNKCDLVDDRTLSTIEAKIHELKGDTRIIRTIRSQVPLPLILSVALFDRNRDILTAEPCLDASAPSGHDHHHAAIDGFDAVSFVSDRPLMVDRFQSFLDRELSNDVFRGKGILWMDESNARLVFHLVGNRFSLDESRWTGPRKNALVLIGRNLDAAKLRRRLEACLASAQGS